MKSYDFDCVIYDGCVFCVECLPEGVDVEYDEVCPVFADSEVNAPLVCERCHAVHDYMNIIE